MTTQGTQTSAPGGEGQHPEHAMRSVRHLSTPQIEYATSAASVLRTPDSTATSEDADRLIGEPGIHIVQPPTPLHTLQSSQRENNYDSHWAQSSLPTNSPVISQLRRHDEEQGRRSLDRLETSSQITSARPAFETQLACPSDQDASVPFQSTAVQATGTHGDLHVVGRKRQREGHEGTSPRDPYSDALLID
jgi:hypothetical protein